ncbi:hypothetical protein V1264_002196 [Littorina saxatilis]|uniref:TELO2-interacting protein 2 n=2 Tax=Littorina saxatilis TaxID=31220 RepID=A0AAN9C4J6_9CAEN
MQSSGSLLDLMDSIRSTKCNSQKISLVRKAITTTRGLDRELLRASMQTTILAPLFNEVVQLAIPAEFKDRDHFLFEKEDFVLLTDQTELVLNFLHVMFEQCCRCSGTLDTKPVDESLPLLVVVISANIRNCLWSRDSVQKLTLLVLNQLRILYKVDSLSEMLLLDLKSKAREATTATLLGRYLTVVKARLSLHNWQANPTFVESFYWMLTQMMKFPHLSEHLDAVLPPALLLVDSHVTEHKVMGIQCLQHIAANVTNEELRWYGRADVVYTALQQQIYSREPDIIKALHPALLIVLPIVDKDPAKPASPTTPKQVDAILTIIITSAVTENGIVLRRMYTACIADFVLGLGVCSVRHLQRLVALISDYLEVFDGPEEHARFNTLSILKSLLRNAWLRIPYHSHAILKSLLKLLQDVSCDRSSTPESVKDRLKEEAVVCLNLLGEICPDVQQCLQALCETDKLSDLARIVQSLLKRNV